MTNNNEKQVQKVISKQLLKNPVFDNDLHISYYSEKILEQIHIDTMFWMVADGVDYDDPKLLPILVIVDVSTRFTQFYYQKRKSEKILEHLTSFINGRIHFLARFVLFCILTNISLLINYL